MQHQHIYIHQLSSLQLHATHIYTDSQGRHTHKSGGHFHQKSIYKSSTKKVKQQDKNTTETINRYVHHSTMYVICLRHHQPQLGFTITYNIYRERAELYAQ